MTSDRGIVITSARMTNSATARGMSSGTLRAYAGSEVPPVGGEIWDCPGWRDPIFLPPNHYEMKNLYKFVLIGSIVLAICIYGLFFNRLSETEMVRWSYVWFPGLLFGAVGLKAGQTSLRLPIIVTVIGMVALFVFFEVIFPAL